MLFRSNDTATTEIYTGIHTLSLHDALLISDSIAVALVVPSASGGLETPDGHAVRCGAGDYCYFWRPGPELRGIPVTTSASVILWGLGILLAGVGILAAFAEPLFRYLLLVLSLLFMIAVTRAIMSYERRPPKPAAEPPVSPA